jgi:hypothetical protein
MVSLFLANCNKLVEIPGLDKLFLSIWEIQLAGCSSKLTNTSKQSIIQVLSLSLSQNTYFFQSTAYIHLAFDGTGMDSE